MGDFQDVFGAVADVESIIDGFAAIEIALKHCPMYSRKQLINFGEWIEPR